MFCDYGNTVFFSNCPTDIENLCDQYQVDEELIDELNKFPKYRGKVNLRGGVVITIKPLYERESELAFIREYLLNWGDRYRAYAAGFTSIDIMRKNYNKAAMINKIVKLMNWDRHDIVFVGNELNEGSEMEIKKTGIRTYNVRDVFECNVFLKIRNRISGKEAVN